MAVSALLGDSKLNPSKQGSRLNVISQSNLQFFQGNKDLGDQLQYLQRPPALPNLDHALAFHRDCAVNGLNSVLKVARAFGGRKLFPLL